MTSQKRTIRSKGSPSFENIGAPCRPTTWRAVSPAPSLPARFISVRAFFSILLLLTLVASTAARAETHALSLAGTWRFELDRRDAGEGQQWFNRTLTGHLKLPGSLQEQGFGDDVTTNTPWTGGTGDRAYFTQDRYAPYREPGNIKVPFWLQPEKYYVGAAWYQRDVTIPKMWQGKRLVLHLERPHWGTTVWLDDHKLGQRDALGVPHDYDLGTGVLPGRHRLTIRVDNRVLVPVGQDAHSVTDHTQGNWNGLVGDLAITATEPVWFENVQVFPDVRAHKVHVHCELGNLTGQAGSGTLNATASCSDATKTAPKQVPVQWTSNGGTAEFDYELGTEAAPWDEFHPALYQLTLQVPGVTAPKTVTFGLREVGVSGKQITVNGRKIFLRGTLECCIFPLHGYPPTDVESWKRILRVARAHGLNHLRFHSWCPPEAAFVAADELGFYYQVECSAWAREFGQRGPLDTWIYAESERMVKARGNHPSFLLMVPSNEPSGRDFKGFLGRWVEFWKAKDSRRLYTAGSGWPSIPENQYHVTPGSRAFPVHALLGETSNDYSAFLARQTVPVVSHEIGQYCVFPNLDEIPKYRGLLKPKNFEIVRDFLSQAGLLSQARDFLHASGRLQALFYKDEIEACLRTPGWAGFQLLDLHDFPGQGTALVGVLDPFWEEKGYIKPTEYRRFCDETVPLARLSKRIWTGDETFRAKLDVAHFGPLDLESAVAHWRVRDAAGKTLADGAFSPSKLPTGNVTMVGEMTLPLARFERATALNLEVTIAGTRFANDWNFWVYPANQAEGSAANEQTPLTPTLSQRERERVVAGHPLPLGEGQGEGDPFSSSSHLPAPISPPSRPLVTSSLDEAALTALRHGARVVLLADPRSVRGLTVGRFDPIFWNRLWFPTQPQHTLGLLLNPKHPSLAGFPTASHADWQWQDLQNHSKPIPLGTLPRSLQPLIQVIDDWNTCRKLGLAFEAKVGPGRLLVCSVDLSHDLEHRPAARQLRRSLLDYAAGDRFNPKIQVQPGQIQSLFRELNTAEKIGAKIISSDSHQPGYEPALLLDGDPQTCWHTAWGDAAPGFPHEVVLGFNQPARLAGVTLLPRQDGNRNGWIKDYAIYLSDDGQAWGEPVAKGRLTRDAQEKEIAFATPATARFLKLVALSGFDDQPFASLAELGLITR